MTTYDHIGVTYNHTRRPDPRIAARIHGALGDASTVLAVEPSQVMIWRKSSYSSNEGPECVEVAGAHRGVWVRDSKGGPGPRLVFASAAWCALVSDVADR